MKTIINCVDVVVNKPLIALTGTRVDLRTFTREILPLPRAQYQNESAIEKKFPSKQIDDDDVRGLNIDKASCMICKEKFIKGEKVRFTVGCWCSQLLYHVECIDTWLMHNASCPQCRMEYIKPKKPIFGNYYRRCPDSSIPSSRRVSSTQSAALLNSLRRSGQTPSSIEARSGGTVEAGPAGAVGLSPIIISTSVDGWSDVPATFRNLEPVSGAKSTQSLIKSAYKSLPSDETSDEGWTSASSTYSSDYFEGRETV